MKTFQIASEYEHQNVAEASDLWPQLYPRHYHTPEGYLPIKQYASSCHRMLSVALHDLNRADEISQSEWVTAQVKKLLSSCLIQYEQQMFWLGRDIGSALIATNPDESVKLSEVPWPFPAFTVMFPYGLISTEVGALAFCSIGIEPENPDANLRGCVFRMLSVDERGVPLSQYWKGGLDQSVAEATKGSERHVNSRVPEFHSDVDWAKSELVLQRVIALVVNICFYINSTAEAVSLPTVGGVHKKGQEKISWWTPRWVGQRYKIKRENLVSGTHASPKMHWRRGHFRQQRVGEGRTQTKTIWIEPMLVSAKTAEGT
jgi:hypothetical protein